VRIIRIYQPGNYQSGQILELSPKASQHVHSVLRMQVGEPLTLFCGDNREFDAMIHEIKKKQVLVLVKSIKAVDRESSLVVHLAQAISKGERMEFVMQKSVELGVSSIIPVVTERCVLKLNQDRMDKKLRQWQAIVIAACEQSGRNVVPSVYQPLSFTQYLQEVRAQLKLILHPGTNKRCSDYLLKDNDIALLIGPEGGFSEGEIHCAQEYGFLPLSLGPRILRTETATIAALSVLQAAGGDL
jgi:16S rRNA (uracil1498-N3)-methyltransferase